MDSIRNTNLVFSRCQAADRGRHERAWLATSLNVASNVIVISDPGLGQNLGVPGKD